MTFRHQNSVNLEASGVFSNRNKGNFCLLCFQVLYNQFKYFYNLYFLLLACSQFIKELRLGALYTYWVPLVCVSPPGFCSCVFWMKEVPKTCPFASPGFCSEYYHHKRRRWRNKMLPSRQRSELSDLQQAFHKRWGLNTLIQVSKSKTILSSNSRSILTYSTSDPALFLNS